MTLRHSLIVHRGPAIPLRDILVTAAELFGGHIRPDADVAVFTSAPVRVQRRPGETDPMAGTVRCVHLAARDDGEPHLTALSPLVLAPRMGFEDEEEEGWSLFGGLPTEAVACALSEHHGAMAVLSSSDGPDLFGAYSLFSGGRRLWSALFRPAEFYATWDGHGMRMEPMAASDPTPPEGGHSDFPVHGLQLLFGEPMARRDKERTALLPSLIRACRPPSTDSQSALLVRAGRFLAPDTELSEEQVEALSASLMEPPNR